MVVISGRSTKMGAYVKPNSIGNRAIYSYNHKELSNYANLYFISLFMGENARSTSLRIRHRRCRGKLHGHDEEDSISDL